MIIRFDKYQGAGNDFLILDNREEKYSSLTTAQIHFLCNRNKGVGADGLILIHTDNSSDFRMQYFNSDGKESTLCGNGGRCAVAFAKDKKITSNNIIFNASDGLHSAFYKNSIEVKIEMKEVNEFSKVGDGFIADTGSPHYVCLVDDVQAVNVEEEGSAIRYSEAFMPEGINVNFVEKVDATHYNIRTYERGVEGETLACGTGAVAAALALHYMKQSEGEKNLNLSALGGDLNVSFKVEDGKYHQIFLKGPAKFVFSGAIEL
ncbi:MAG: diaminopimelate epimerase [Flavobacteriaceae bacterium]|jgi:diaminopimelate epimerase|nr:diaminopimelate epimerase [Flavobacteriaceae bacterium]